MCVCQPRAVDRHGGILVSLRARNPFSLPCLPPDSGGRTRRESLFAALQKSQRKDTWNDRETKHQRCRCAGSPRRLRAGARDRKCGSHAPHQRANSRHVQGKIPETFADQAQLVWRNIEAQPRAADISLVNLVRSRRSCPTVDIAMKNRAVRQAILGDRTPCLTVIITGIFDPVWLLEIEAIAVA